MKITIVLFFALISTGLYGQKKTIDHTVYDSWNSISNIKQSPNGTIITYEINPQVGDGKLYIEDGEGNYKRAFNRGKNIQLNYAENFVVFVIKPQADTIRKLKLDKIKKDKFPKDTLAIYHPKTDSLYTIPAIKSFQLAKKGDWIAYLSAEDERTDSIQKKKRFCKRKKETPKKIETSGTTLHLYNPITDKKSTIDRVKNYKMSKNGDFLLYVTSNKGKEDSLSLYRIDLETMEHIILVENQLKITKIKFDYQNKQVVFLHSIDTNKRKTFSLSYWNTDLTTAKIIVDSTTTGMPENYTVSEFSNSYFSRDGKRIFVGTNTIVKQDPKDTLLDTEKAKVDVWSGFDLQLQPQQLKQLKGEEEKNYKAVYSIASKELIQIENDTLNRLRTIDHGNGNLALMSYTKPYQKSFNWAFPWKRDMYLVDLTTGENKNLITGQGYPTYLAPSGTYFIWYNGTDSSWYSKTIEGEVKNNLTKTLKAEFASENNGNPFVPFPEGNSGWTKIDGIEYFLVSSRWDIWALCLADNSKTFCVSNQQGKLQKQRFDYQKLDTDSTYTTLENNLLHSQNFETKAEAYYAINNTNGSFKIDELISSDHKFIFLNKAEKSNDILFRRMCFETYPELEKTTLKFDSFKTLTHANPQQDDYNWGTVEMVEWTSYKGIELRGLLYKPENFDSTKSYPMIAYFYEKLTDNLHNYYTPKPTPSIVFPTEYVSNGYIIFIPDVEYTPGHPAASAYDCIVSGTDYLTKKFTWIDSTRMGLQGQSWGGYQTAQLITMTGKYKAAMAGAPVSNMFSAYGGIRWGSGLSRMFQYERTQSRIGYTIWEKPELYIENSPIFGLPNVTTPLLIMHNDGDGAVPWYQGIEMYMGLRRLNQPVWLLNYNGDQHNLMQRANRIDLSIRMRQFFDYYLLNSEMPMWMDEGVPAINKGKDYGLELKKD